MMTVKSTNDRYASIAAMERLHAGLSEMRRSENSGEAKASLISRIKSASAQQDDGITLLCIEKFDSARASLITHYTVTIAAPIADVIMQLNKAGAHFPPARPNAKGYLVSERPAPSVT